MPRISRTAVPVAILLAFAAGEPAPGSGSGVITVPSGKPCGAVAVPVEPSMFGYGPTVGAQAVWARKVSCRSARRVVRALVGGLGTPAGWSCAYEPFNPIACRGPGGRRIETLTVSDGR